MIWVDDDITELGELLAESGITAIQCDFNGTNFRISVTRGWETMAARALARFHERLKAVPDRLRYEFIQKLDGKVARYKPSTQGHTLH